MSVDPQDVLAEFFRLSESDQKEVVANVPGKARALLDATNELRQKTELLCNAIRERKQSDRSEATADDPPESDQADILPPDEWVTEFRKWVSDRGVRNPAVDVSRESIYPDR